MNEILQLMHDTMSKTAQIKGSVSLLRKEGLSEMDKSKLLEIIESQAHQLNEVLDAYYNKNNVSGK